MSKYEIILDTDKELNLETNSFSKKVINFFLVPILNILPECSRNFIRRSHPTADYVVKEATTHTACEVLYQHSNKKKYQESLYKKIFRKIWMETSNSKAIRNRLKLVKRELKEKIINLSSKQDHIRIISIAAGSARGVVEVLQEVIPQIPKSCSFDIVFLDKDPKATEYSKSLVGESNLGCNFSWVNATAGTYLKENRDQKFDIVEMVGLMDYFTDEKVVDIFTDIYNILSVNGMLLTANIMDNQERQFLTKAIGWKMIYRKADEFAQLAERAGFSHDKIRVYLEPLKIHCIVRAEK